MSEQPQDRIQQLQDLVEEMGSALAAGERRTRSMERTLRWGAIGVLALLGLTISFNFDLLGNALAQPEGGGAGQKPETVVDALNSINENLGGLGMMTQMMQVTMRGAIDRAWREQNDNHIKKKNKPGLDIQKFGSPLGAYVESYTERQCANLPTDAEMNGTGSGKIGGMPMDEFCSLYKEQFLPGLPILKPGDSPISGDKAVQFQQAMGEMYQGAIMEAMGNVMVDTGVLMYRIRRDSNYIRDVVEKIGGPDEILAGIRDELRTLNGMMAAIPVMATRMDAMTAQMGVMSHSMGSTMGRAGSWMPW